MATFFDQNHLSFAGAAVLGKENGGVGIDLEEQNLKKKFFILLILSPSLLEPITYRHCDCYSLFGAFR